MDKGPLPRMLQVLGMNTQTLFLLRPPPSFLLQLTLCNTAQSLNSARAITARYSLCVSCYILPSSHLLLLKSKHTGLASTSQPLPPIVALSHHRPVKMSSKSTTADAKAEFEPPSLIPCPITLSLVHLDITAEELEKYPVIALTIPATSTTPAVHFNALLQETTTRCLMLESFYNECVANKAAVVSEGPVKLEESYYQKFSLASRGISHCVFQSALAELQEDSHWKNRSAPDFKVGGTSCVPISLDGHLFTPNFFLLDHIFSSSGFESDIVAILGSSFLRENFIRAQWTSDGHELKLPPVISDPIDHLAVFTAGCCLKGGAGGNVDRAGYGVHFANLPREDPADWDISSPLFAGEKHTNQRADLIAVIRALQLIKSRQISCSQIQIRTDSTYVVQSMKEMGPQWRTSGYASSLNKNVANADLFNRLDIMISYYRLHDEVSVSLEHITSEANSTAVALSKAGAGCVPGGPNFKVPNPDGSEESFVKTADRPMLVLSQETYEVMQPLIQWTPDGVHWVRFNSPPGNFLVQVDDLVPNPI